MKPPEHTAVTVSVFLAIVQRYWSELGWVFRGQANIDWPLLPKAGRPEYYSDAVGVWVERGQTSIDLARFNFWREQAVAFSPSLPTNDFECLAFAQHYGLATRLLDWSTNPLVALFFAVEALGDAEGAVFCHMPWWVIDLKTSSFDRPFNRVPMLIPRPFDRRIAAQSGVFTYHDKPKEALTVNAVTPEAREGSPEGVDLVVIRVPGETKAMLQRQLSAVGISRKALFPDLEGLSSFINWGTRNQAEWHQRKKSDAGD